MGLNIFENFLPCSLNSTQSLEVGAASWGALTSFKLEFIKLNRFQGKVRSTALLSLIDPLGRASVFFEGSTIEMLLGCNAEEWSLLEDLTKTAELFYRPFKNGLNDTFPIEQKLFYLMCEKNVYKDVLFISFIRQKNNRKGEETIPFLKVVECVRSNPKLLNLYHKNLRSQ